MKAISDKKDVGRSQERKNIENEMTEGDEERLKKQEQ
jgi:hypothetical protein